MHTAATSPRQLSCNYILDMGSSSSTLKILWRYAKWSDVCRFAHVQDMARGATTLVFTFYPGMRLQSKAAMGVAISRLIEERVGLAEGMDDVRKWLIIISRAFPAQQPNRQAASQCMYALIRRASARLSSRAE